MPAIPYKHTKTSSSGWDASKQVANLETPLTKATADAVYAWVDPDGDPTVKSSYRFPHHFISDHVPGAASSSACSSGIASLNGARTPTTIPPSDKAGVYAHLRQHLVDHGVDPETIPTLRGASMTATTKKPTLKCPACKGTGKLTGGKSPSENLPCPECDGEGEVAMATTSDRSASGQRAALYEDDDLRGDVRGANEYRCVREMDPFERLAPRFEMREVANGTGGTSLRFSGYASVVDHGYEVFDQFGPFTETIDRNAFNKTLRDGADVSFLVNHTGITMARTKSGTLQLSSDSTGLYTEATLNPSRPDVQVIRAAIEDKDLDEMSFAFRATRQEWNVPDYTERQILEANLHQGDVSVVNFGANGATAGLLDLRGRRAMAQHSRPAPTISRRKVKSCVDDEFMKLQMVQLEIAKRGR